MRFLWTVVYLAPLCSAFYPYHQPKTGGGHTSKTSPRAIEHPRSHQSQSKREPFYPLRLSIAEEEQPASKASSGAIEHPQSGNDGPLRMLVRKILTPRKNIFAVQTAADPKQSNSVGVDQDGTDFSYFCAFKIGTSQEEYYFLLDSAASNTWVMASGCTSNACSVHNTLGASDSSTLQVLTSTFSVSYGTGSVKGMLGSDTVHFSTISIPLTFGLGTTVSDEFSSYPMDGILGLGRPDTITNSNSGVNAPSIMDVLISQKVINKKFYAVDLWRSADGGSNDGEINFGAPDTSRYDGDLNYIAAIRNSNGFWEIPAADASVDGKSAGLTGRSAIIDTGTSFILMPQGDAEKIHALIPGSSQNGEAFTLPCDTKNKVQFTFGKTTYDIDPRDYVGRSVGGGGCSSNIVGRQTFGATQWLVGDVFLKNVYAAFDFDGQRVGFGVKGAGGSAATTTTTTANPPSKSTDSMQSPSPTPTVITTNTPAPTITPTPAPIAASALSTPPSPLAPTHTSPVAQATSPSTTTESPEAPTSPPTTSLHEPTLTDSSQADSSVTVQNPSATNSAGDGPTFTAGFLPPGSSFTTSQSPGPATPVSASSTSAQKTGTGSRERQPAALLALALALLFSAVIVAG